MEQCGLGDVEGGRSGDAGPEYGNIVSLDDSGVGRVDEGSNNGGVWSVGGGVIPLI